MQKQYTYPLQFEQVITLILCFYGMLSIQSIENAPALEELLPPKGVPNFKYGGEGGRDGTEYALSSELSGMVKGRQTVREIISWMEESVIPVHGFEITLSVIVQTLLDIGSKSSFDTK